MTEFRRETDSMGAVDVPADKLWGAQTQRSLEHFSIGHDLMPREMITGYAILKRSAAVANHAGGRLNDTAHGLIVKTCDEIPGRPASRHVPAARLDDGQRHAVQHERERGDLQPVLPACRHRARQQDAGASERPRQHVAVVQRQLPLHDVHRCRGQRHQPPGARGDRAARCDRRRKPRSGMASSRSAAPTCRTRRR